MSSNSTFLPAIAFSCDSSVAGVAPISAFVVSDFPVADIHKLSNGSCLAMMLHDDSISSKTSLSFTAEINHSYLKSLQNENDKLRQQSAQAEKNAMNRLLKVAAIFGTGQALPLLEDAQLLQSIVDRMALLMEAQACSILLLDEGHNRLRIAASYGLPPDVRAQTQLLGEGIAGSIIHSEEPLLISETAQRDPRLENVTLKPGMGSAILVPMKDRDNQSLGVVCIRRRPDKTQFAAEEVKIFSIFASQTALALTNSRLVKDLNRRTGELLKISTLSRALLSTIDLDTLLRTAVEEICSVVGCDRCCLYWRESNKSVLTSRFFQGYPESISRNPVKMGEGAVGLAAESKIILHFDSQVPASSDKVELMHYRKMKGFARSLGTDSFIAIPILTSNETCIGVFVADNKLQHLPISMAQRDLLMAFVSQAGIAIENALLYEQMQINVSNLRRLKDYTDNVLQSIESAILTTDGRGHTVRCNRAAEEILNCSEKALRDVPLAEALSNLRLPAEEADRLLALALRVLETGEAVHRLKLTLHPHERPPITVYLMVSRLPDHKIDRSALARIERAGLVIIFEDVTQEVRLELELEKMRRLADIGQLAAKMAHEVRNALSPIKGAAQIIRNTMGKWHNEASKGHEWPDMIIAEVDGLSQLVTEMLNFARPTSLDPRPIEINAFLETALQSMRVFLDEHGVKVCWELKENIPTIQADVVQLGQVVRNLVMNAAQSMSNGGVLTIGSEMEASQRAVAIRIEDTGRGISPEDHERIFRPFVTTRPKGTGLGLPIVQKIVDHHGGRVEIQSNVGEGTRFTVYLPLCPPVFSPDEEGTENSWSQKSDLRRLDTPLIYDRPTGNFPDN